MIKNRISRLREHLKRKQIPALLVTVPANRFYLSAFTPDDGQPGESAGALLISRQAAILLTDFRYQLTAESQAEYYDVQVYTTGLAQELVMLTQELGLKSLAVEAAGLTLAQWELLQRNLPEIELISCVGLVEELRQIKDSGEIKAITHSLAIMEKSLRKVMDEGVVGKEEIHVARLLARTVEDMGGDGLSFAAIVASGPNGAEPHAHAGRELIAAGRPLVIDVGACYQKYASDITRTYLPQDGGDKKWHQIYPVVRDALQAALAGIRPGMQGHEADDIARQVIVDAGYGRNFGHSLGHGVGLMVHEAPSLSPRSREILKPGMVFTLEPGIYIPGWGGIRLEQMVELTPQGCRLLNQLDDFYDIRPA